MTNDEALEMAADVGPLRGAIRAIEWPTMLLLAAVFTVWGVLTYHYRVWPLWVIAPATAVLLTLHSSIQHEIVHGHPTKWRALNRCLGMVPLSFWLPYQRYRDTHLIHHINDRLTDPADDPESNYWRAEDWERMSAFSRKVTRLQLTLAGRVLIGSFWRIGRFLRMEFQAALRGDRGVRGAWIEHLLWCVPIVLWLHFVCAMPLWIYVLCMVIPGNGILLIRSFVEHRARPGMRERTAIVENARLLGPLFLYNSLHSLHHEEPLLPWYQYQARYRVVRDRLIADNGGMVYSSYLDIARRYLFTENDAPVHPTNGVPRRRA